MIALKSFSLDQSNSGKLPTIKTSSKGNCRKGNVKKSKKLMKIVNVDKENLQIFQTTSITLMTFSGKLCLMIKVYAFRKQIDFPPSWASIKLAPIATETAMVAKRNS